MVNSCKDAEEEMENSVLIYSGKFGKLVNIKDFVEVVHECLEEKYMMKS